MKVTVEKQFTALPARPLPERRVVDRLPAALDQLAESSPRIVSRSLGQFESGAKLFVAALRLSRSEEWRRCHPHRYLCDHPR